MPSEISAADLKKLKALDKQLTTIVNHATASAIYDAKGLTGGKRRKSRTSTKKTTRKSKKSKKSTHSKH